MDDILYGSAKALAQAIRERAERKRTGPPARLPDYGHRCGICVSEGPLEAHEIWEYEDVLQRLAGLIALCKPCHNVKHMGRSGILATRGQLNPEILVEHFLTVNGCTRREFEEHLRDSFALWERSSQQDGWKVDWGPFQDLISGGRSSPETDI